jgi:predicted Zn-dependent protease with MMP-like domain
MALDWGRLQDLARDEVAATLASLPLPLRERAGALPVTIERRPSPELCRDGIELDTLGLFVGPEFADEGASPLPAQIILFIENLWEQAEGDPEMFRDEIHITYLHELGHYLGLDEDDLFDRGLD